MYTLDELAKFVGGRVCGDGSIEIKGADTLAVAGPSQITFVRSDKHQNELGTSKASAVVVPVDFKSDLPSIEVAEPEKSFAKIVSLFRRQFQSSFQGISPAAHISPTAQLGQNVTIYPGVFIDDDVLIGDNSIIHANVCLHSGCAIGRDVTIFPNSVLYSGTVVQDRVLIHACAVLGAYGFGYETREGRHHLSAQLGNVVIENDCEIGAGTTIDRGTYGETVISEGTKIDNQVMIAHNCKIGRHSLIASQVGIAGSSVCGDYVIMAGQCGIGDHITIGSNAILCAKSGVMNDLAGDQMYAGIPVTPVKEQFHMLAVQARLPEIRQELKKLKRQLDLLDSSRTHSSQPDTSRPDAINSKPSDSVGNAA